MQIDLLGSAALAEIGADHGIAARSAVSAQVANSPAVPEDTASLSSSAPSVPSLASQALASAEARAAKVETLRQAVAGAEYTLHPALIADAMLNEGA